jgi:hypothetical protein
LEDQILVFCYFLQKKEAYSSITHRDLEQCFQVLDLSLPTNINSRLCKIEIKKQLVKSNGGYRVERTKIKNIENDILGKPKLKEISDNLEKLPTLLKKPESDYVKEVINCLKIDAYHAAVILMWVVTISHLRNYVLAFKLKEFNSSLSLRLKYKKKGFTISEYEDFEEIKEMEFLEILKNIGSISKTRHKLLEEKLGIRNTYAHPSPLSLTDAKTVSFIEDLINDIITKIKY